MRCKKTANICNKLWLLTPVSDKRNTAKTCTIFEKCPKTNISNFLGGMDGFPKSHTCAIFSEDIKNYDLWCKIQNCPISNKSQQIIFWGGWFFNFNKDQISNYFWVKLCWT